MRKLTLLLLALTFSLAGFSQRFPAQQNPPKLVNDFADILSDQQERALEEKLLRYGDTTSTQIAVVIVETINDEDPNLYAAELGEKWKVGQSGKDNGLVFLVAKGDREMAIQNGYGLEAVLTDALTKRLIEQYIIPQFKADNYYAGIDEGTDQIFKLLAGEFTGKSKRSSGSKRFPWFLLVLIAIIFFTRFKSGRGGGGGYRGSGGYWIGGMGGSSFGGGSSGGFGGGGFGGFGGGSFGGGGASGSW